MEVPGSHASPQTLPERHELTQDECANVERATCPLSTGATERTAGVWCSPGLWSERAHWHSPDSQRQRKHVFEGNVLRRRVGQGERTHTLVPVSPIPVRRTPILSKAHATRLRNEVPRSVRLSAPTPLPQHSLHSWTPPELLNNDSRQNPQTKLKQAVTVTGTFIVSATTNCHSHCHCHCRVHKRQVSLSLCH